MTDVKSPLGLVLLGDSQAGKSTILGHLMFDLGAVDKFQLDNAEKLALDLGRKHAKFNLVSRFRRASIDAELGSCRQTPYQCAEVSENREHHSNPCICTCILDTLHGVIQMPALTYSIEKCACGEYHTCIGVGLHAWTCEMHIFASIRLFTAQCNLWA